MTGGFAGALGICQFMPSNIEKLGIDMDGDGKVDLTASTADAVASAANYLKSVGWDNRLPVTWPCRVSEAAARELDTGEARLTTTLQNALDAGVEPQGYVPFPPATPVLLVSLPTPSKEDPKAKSTFWEA